MSKLEYSDHLKCSFTEPNLKMLHPEETLDTSLPTQGIFQFIYITGQSLYIEITETT